MREDMKHGGTAGNRLEWRCFGDLASHPTVNCAISLQSSLSDASLSRATFTHYSSSQGESHCKGRQGLCGLTVISTALPRANVYGSILCMWVKTLYPLYACVTGVVAGAEKGESEWLWMMEGLGETQN